MSWTDVFPVLSDDQIVEYESLATESDRALLAGLCDVARVENPRSGPHLVATSLFWKPAHAAEPGFPAPTRQLLKDAARLGLVSRHAPWEHYVQPLLDGAEKLREERPDIVFRVYLAADLEFLVTDLVAVGCEVMVMRNSSLRHNPGALWRFLAFEEEGRWITITDADHAPEILHNIERTEHAMRAGHGLWRAPYILDGGGPDNDPGFYRPINACQFGAAGGYPVSDLMKAMIWHTLRGTMPDFCTIGATEDVRRETPIFGSDWPNYGFDEWFLLASKAPRSLSSRCYSVTLSNARKVPLYSSPPNRTSRRLPGQLLGKAPLQLPPALDLLRQPPGPRLHRPSACRSNGASTNS